MKLFRKFPFLFFFLFLSCIKQLDFDQVNDVSISPTYKASLVYFTVNQTDFLLNTTEIPTVTSEFPFTIIDNSIIRENLKEVELEFEIRNEFPRNFRINLQFLDDNDLVTYTFSEFIIDSNALNFNRKVSIIIASNLRFLETTKLLFTISLLPSSDGSVLDPDIIQTLAFKLAGTYFFQT